MDFFYDRLTRRSIKINWRFFRRRVTICDDKNRELHMNKALAIALALAISACATNPNRISTAYVSPGKYKDWNCDQIDAERAHIEERTVVLYNQLKRESKGDAWQMGVGVVLFWPVLLALEGGDGPEAAEYSQLKGEYEALRKNSISKQCDFEFQADLKNLAKKK